MFKGMIQLWPIKSTPILMLCFRLKPQTTNKYAHYKANPTVTIRSNLDRNLAGIDHGRHVPFHTVPSMTKVFWAGVRSKTHKRSAKTFRQTIEINFQTANRN